MYDAENYDAGYMMSQGSIFRSGASSISLLVL